MSGRRPEKLGSEIQHVLAGIFREKYQHLFPDVLLTVTEVKVTDDLREAKIFCSFYSENPEHSEDLYRTLRNDIRKLRHDIAAGIVVKYMPRISILKDETQEYAEKINRLLRDI